MKMIKLGLLMLVTLIGSFMVNVFAQKRPNIVWIVAEDLSQDLGCYGNKLVHTPTLDKLAKDGMQYNNMYTTASVCAPSRTALATGMYQNSIGAMHMSYSEALMPELPSDVKTVAQILAENDYQTLGVGKDHYLFQIPEKSFQFKQLDDIDPDKPFFAKINSFFAHRPFYNDSINPVDPNNIVPDIYYPNVRPIREDLAAYYENVQLLDREVQRFMNELQSRGLLENTIIFFFSDHGSPMLRGKYWMYDSGLKIPFIVYASKDMDKPKGYLPGSVNEQLFSLIDLSATTLHLAGIAIPDYMQGKPFLGEHKIDKRDYVFASQDRIGGVYFKSRAVRSGQYKYIINYNNGQSVLEMSTEYRKARLPFYNTIKILDDNNKLTGAEKTLVTPLPLEELYDLENDPLEINNLAENDEYEGIKKELEKVLIAWMEDIDDKGLYEDSPAIQKHFIDYRTKNKENFREEKFDSYLEILNQLKEDGNI